MLTVFGQKQGNIWYFGTFAGIDFNGVNPVPLSNSALQTTEGSSVISDEDGALLFYTDGSTVWNRLHQVMSNGTGLFGHFSATQSAVIVPQPGNDSIYYIFTVDAVPGAGGIGGSLRGLHYSVVNLNLDGGFGGVTAEKNVLLLSGTTEKLTATLHANGQDIWVMTHEFDGDRFFAYQVSCSGISDAVVTSIGSYIGWTSGDSTNYTRGAGQMKFSPDGSKLAVATVSLNRNNGMEIFEFDNETGVVSSLIVKVAVTETGYDYGLEFSPDNSKLYLATTIPLALCGNINFNIYQYDLSDLNPSQIDASRVLVSSLDMAVDFNCLLAGVLQLAPDGKIYQAIGGSNSLGVINQPNEKGVDCDYDAQGFSLGARISRLGLPSFIQSYFSPSFGKLTHDNECDNSEVIFTASETGIDSLIWNFGDTISGNPNISRESNGIHVYSEPGIYNVTLDLYSCGTATTYEEAVFIRPSPKIDLGNDTILCSDENEQKSLELEAEISDGTYIWQPGGEVTSSIRVSNSGIYSVTVTNTQDCSDSDSIEIEILDCIPEVPNVFTPNSDGDNDFFFVNGNGISGNYQLEIFNRWGQKVFESLNVNDRWNGKDFNTGNDASEGVYFYALNVTLPTEKIYRSEGFITLLR